MSLSWKIGSCDTGKGTYSVHRMFETDKGSYLSLFTNVQIGDGCTDKDIGYFHTIAEAIQACEDDFKSSQVVEIMMDEEELIYQLSEVAIKYTRAVDDLNRLESRSHEDDTREAHRHRNEQINIAQKHQHEMFEQLIQAGKKIV